MKFAVIGANGRMGQEIFQVLLEKRHTPHLGIVNSGVAQGFKNSSVGYDENKVEKVDCVIDFSLPSSLSLISEKFVRAGIPLVSGVTGYTSTELNRLKKFGQFAPVFWSPNMSLGVHLLKRAITQIEGQMGFTFVVEETHHSKKIDAPSGTAKLLQSTLEKKLKPKDLQKPISIRGGGVIGHHRVIGLGEYETICFEHQALSRKVFAAGAVQVAEWLKRKKNGFYDMEDFFQKNT
jgi:4-hydroxy-tetrahydrodipicolinate reductase